MKSSVVDRPGPKKSSFDQVPSRSSPVVSSRDPRIASNRPVEANIHPPAKTSKKESPIEVVKDSAPSSHNFTKFLEDSRKKLNSINSFLDSEVNSSILPSSIVEILRKASKAATPPLSSPKLPEDPIEIPRIVPKPTVIPEKLIVDDEPEVFVIKSDKQKAPKKKESVFLTTNILKPPGSQGLIKIIEVPPAMPGFKPFSFMPVPPPIMSANPPQRLQPKLPIIIPPIKRKDPDFGAGKLI